jgi:hypothetical protein
LDHLKNGRRDWAQRSQGTQNTNPQTFVPSRLCESSISRQDIRIRFPIGHSLPASPSGGRGGALPSRGMGRGTRGAERGAGGVKSGPISRRGTLQANRPGRRDNSRNTERVQDKARAFSRASCSKALLIRWISLDDAPTCLATVRQVDVAAATSLRIFRASERESA